ncbi:MAG: dihydroorotase [Lachnospiraceae bacterium]|nr:dihydroorotase [Lachnospiraceae bacterium]
MYLKEDSMILRNGHVVDPANGIDGKCDIRFENGVITEVAPVIHADGSDELDCRGAYVIPGLVDLHVHLRDPGQTAKETLATGTAAAAAGGYTAVAPMPNTSPSTDSAEKITALLARAKDECRVKLLPITAVTLGQEGTTMADLAAAKAAGAVAMSEDGKSVMDITVYREALRTAAKLGLPMLAHCEDKNLVAGGVINEGVASKKLGLPGITNAVEDVIAARDLILAGETGCHVHLCHVSTAFSAELLKIAKEAGYPVSGEVCPHHFAMCDDEIPEDDANYKMNPPLRSRADMQALCEALRDGVIDCISTDHAPHTAEEKSRGFLKAPFGIVGSETAFALAYTTLVKGGYLDMPALVRLMSTNPSKIVGHTGGTLSVGAPANIAVVTGEETRIDASEFQSKGKNTPFDGRRVYGKVLATYVDGRRVY